MRLLDFEGAAWASSPDPSSASESSGSESTYLSALSVSISWPMRKEIRTHTLLLPRSRQKGVLRAPPRAVRRLLVCAFW